MIGWYVHHQGSGHLHRASAVRARLRGSVTGLSSLPRPTGWDGEWLQLDRDDDEDPADVTAGGRLHWAPRHHDGQRRRMAAISAWIAEQRPALLVADVSAEVAVLARLHGVPVASVVLPGDRSDSTHQLGYGVSSVLVAVWPGSALGMVAGLTPDLVARLVTVGGLSRFPVAPEASRRPGPPRVTVLQGAGGSLVGAGSLIDARRETPEWEWTVLGPGSWADDPWTSLCDADVVVTHAGQNAVAEVAAARRPAVVIPADRPHAEQRSTARVLSRRPWPVVVEGSWPEGGWLSRLEGTARLDGSAWGSWVDDGAAGRMAAVLEAAAAERSPASL